MSPTSSGPSTAPEWMDEYEPWKQPRTLFEVFQREVAEGERRARLARVVLERARAIADGRRSAERTWAAICANLRKPYGSP